MTEGERWAQTELDALRGAHFRPPAISHFLAESWRRAAVTRRSRPEVARQARAWTAVGFAAGLAARRAGAKLGIATPSPRAWIAWSAGTAAMLDWHLGMLEGPDGEPRERLRATDALTLTRIGLAPFVATADRGTVLSALVTAAGATDLLDGRLARRTGTSRLGRDLDRAADVALKIAAARAARRGGWLTPTTTCLVVGCQTASVAYVAATYFAKGRAPTGARNAPRWIAPAPLSGLALAPHAARTGNALAAAASLATVAAVWR